MCRELDALRQSIVTYGGQFDPRSLTPVQAGHVVRVCAQIEASVASLKALAAARSAEGNAWQHEGYRSPAHQLAEQAGMSPSAAKRALDTGRRMTDQPEVATAALAGELSAEQAAAVSDGVAANPAQAKELIDKAKHSSVPELNEQVARTKAVATDQEARRRAIHAKRSLRRWTDRDGALQAHLYGHPEDGAGLWRMLDPIRRRLNILRRDDSAANEALDALDYDALMAIASIAAGHDGELGLVDLLDLGLFPQLEPAVLAGRPYVTASAPGTKPATGNPPLARSDADPAAPSPPDAEPDSPNLFSVLSSAYPSDGTSAPPEPIAGSASPSDPIAGSASPPGKGRRGKKLAGSPARIMIRVDLDSLLRGFPIEGELCEIIGYGPIPVSVIEELVANDNAFVVGVLTKAEQLLGVYHRRRRPNAYQQSALDFLYPSCAVAGCSARVGLQSDHRVDWAKTKFTVFDLLDRLCPHHHALKTRKGWALVAGTGKRAFVPPDDPRHPRHAAGATPNSPVAPAQSSTTAPTGPHHHRRIEAPR
jgi:hypothetical protein